jgi:hypothetical protein
VTLAAWLMLGALALFIAGMLYFSRKPNLRTRLIGVAASALAAGAIGWLAWYASTSPGGA